MTISEQLTSFQSYAEQVLASDEPDVALDEIFSRWWQDQHQDQDVQAVLEAHQQFNDGEQGEDALQELKAFRAERKSGSSQ